MNPTDPSSNLSPEERAFVEALRERARPSAAPGDFARRLRDGGLPSAAADTILAMPSARIRRRVSFALAAAAGVAAAAVVLMWVGVGPIDPENLRPSGAGEGSLSETAARQGGALPLGFSGAPGEALAVHSLGVIRRDHGLPPVQLIAVEGVRVERSGADRRVALETRLVPVALRYH